MKSYWHVSYLTIDEIDGKDRIKRGFNVTMCNTPYFNFVDFYKDFPTFTILNITELTEPQYNSLMDYFKTKNKKIKNESNESES